MEDLGTFCLYFAGIGFIFSSVALLAAVIQGKKSEGKDF
jgi:Na+-transporting methylmalonyl-CoA/oxaloacetate decarboxylase gamma subunit